MGTPQIIEAANLGMADSLILMVMALVVFGPRRLPQIGRQIGKLMYEFRKASNDFKYQMEEELRNAEEAERRKKEEERLKELQLTIPATAVSELTGESGSVSGVTGSQGPDGVSLSHGSQAGEATPSPYPGENAYPELQTAEVPVSEAQPSQLGADQRPIRVQPPTVGEQVPAERPWNLEEKLAELNIPGPEPISFEPPNNDTLTKPATEGTPASTGTSSPVTEQATHHG